MILKIFHCVVAKILPLNFNIPKKMFTYFDLCYVVICIKNVFF